MTLTILNHVETMSNHQAPAEKDELPALSCPLDAPAKSGTRRFNLRKRSFNAERCQVNMSSYNSDFLSGLFADVAKANDVSTLPTSDEVTSTPQEEGTTTEHRECYSNPAKRSRISLTKSISRVGQSCRNLANLFDDLPPLGKQIANSLKPAKCSIDRLDSLHYQLNCVGGKSSSNDKDVNSPKSVMSVMDIGNDAFPNLPTCISDSSCSQDLTRKVDRAESIPETSTPKESYGWFVEMDDGTSSKVADFVDPYKKTADLAFSAVTAPKRSQLDDELEWAKAADTVDDVLGDFF